MKNFLIIFVFSNLIVMADESYFEACNGGLNTAPYEYGEDRNNSNDFSLSEIIKIKNNYLCNIFDKIANQYIPNKSKGIIISTKKDKREYIFKELVKHFLILEAKINLFISEHLYICSSKCAKCFEKYGEIDKNLCDQCISFFEEKGLKYDIELEKKANRYNKKNSSICTSDLNSLIYTIKSNFGIMRNYLAMHAKYKSDINYWSGINRQHGIKEIFNFESHQEKLNLAKHVNPYPYHREEFKIYTKLNPLSIDEINDLDEKFEKKLGSYQSDHKIREEFKEKYTELIKRHPTLAFIDSEDPSMEEISMAIRKIRDISKKFYDKVNSIHYFNISKIYKPIAEIVLDLYPEFCDIADNIKAKEDSWWYIELFLLFSVPMVGCASAGPYYMGCLITTSIIIQGYFYYNLIDNSNTLRLNIFSSPEVKKKILEIDELEYEKFQIVIYTAFSAMLAIQGGNAVIKFLKK